jgi:hypothetical protein
LIFAFVIPVLASIFDPLRWSRSQLYFSRQREIFSLASARFRTQAAFKHSSRDRSLNFSRHVHTGTLQLFELVHREMAQIFVMFGKPNNKIAHPTISL